MIRDVLIIVGLLAAMGVLYLVIRWGAGKWNRFLGEQADRIQIPTRDRDRDSEPPEAPEAPETPNDPRAV